MVVDSAVPRVVHYWCVAGNASSLEPLPRRSVSQSAICTFHQALLCSVSRDRTLVCSCSSCSASVPGLQSHRSSVFATLRSCRRCAWLCASWSVDTSRRRHACIDRPVSMSGGANFFHPLRGPVTTSHRFPSRVIPHGPGHDVPSRGPFVSCSCRLTATFFSAPRLCPSHL